eukprot:2468914-Rhodomonas_salina.1
MVTLHGSGFGTRQVSAFGRSGSTAPEATSWLSDSSVLVLVARGLGASMSIALTAGVNAGSATQLTSFDTLRAIDSARQNLAVTGSSSLTVVGKGFGFRSTSQQVRLTGTACESTFWVSDSSVRCQAVASHKQSTVFAISSGQLTGSFTDGFAYSYDSAHLVQMTVGALSESGPISVSLRGKSLGTSSYSGGARIGESACQASMWQSETSMLCLASRGVSQSKTSVMTVSSFVGSLTEVLSITFVPVTVRGGAPRNLPSSGALGLTVSGGGFGTILLSGVARAGMTGGEASIWISDSSIVSLVARGSRASLRSTATVSQRTGSATQQISYDIPRATDGARQNVAGT